MQLTRRIVATSGGTKLPHETNRTKGKRMNELVVVNPAEMQKRATDVAGVCREIVGKTTVSIGKRGASRMYVKVEGWQAIANAWGCTAGARDVQKVFDEATDEFIGFKAIGEVKRNNDGVVIATGEGFVGKDEVRWFGGEAESWNRETRKMVKKHYEPAPEYAARAMAQTRAISRACRAAFAFVVVLIDEKLSTTPAEEIDPGDEPHGEERVATPAEAAPPAAEDGRRERPANGKRWQQHKCTYGTKGGPLRGKLLGELEDSNLKFLWEKFCGAGAAKTKPSQYDLEMIEGLKLWKVEQGGKAPAEDDEIPF
jgi:hypothetical protein